MAIKNYFQNIFRRYRFKRTGNGFSIDLNFDPIGFKLDRAQFALDTQVWKDMRKYMPWASGNLVRQTNALNNTVIGSGKVYVYDGNVDYAHYMYEGKLYVDPVYRKGAFYSPDYGFWSRPGVTKVPTEKKLSYLDPNATPHWDETAINNHEKEWVELVKKELNS